MNKGEKIADLSAMDLLDAAIHFVADSVETSAQRKQPTRVGRKETQNVSFEREEPSPSPSPSPSFSRRRNPERTSGDDNKGCRPDAYEMGSESEDECRVRLEDIARQERLKAAAQREHEPVDVLGAGAADDMIVDGRDSSDCFPSPSDLASWRFRKTQLRRYLLHWRDAASARTTQRLHHALRQRTEHHEVRAAMPVATQTFQSQQHSPKAEGPTTTPTNAPTATRVNNMVRAVHADAHSLSDIASNDDDQDTSHHQDRTTNQSILNASAARRTRELDLARRRASIRLGRRIDESPSHSFSQQATTPSPRGVTTARRALSGETSFSSQRADEPRSNKESIGHDGRPPVTPSHRTSNATAIPADGRRRRQQDPPAPRANRFAGMVETPSPVVPPPSTRRSPLPSDGRKDSTPFRRSSPSPTRQVNASWTLDADTVAFESWARPSAAIAVSPSVVYESDPRRLSSVVHNQHRKQHHQQHATSTKWARALREQETEARRLAEMWRSSFSHE